MTSAQALPCISVKNVVPAPKYVFAEEFGDYVDNFRTTMGATAVVTVAVMTTAENRPNTSSQSAGASAAHIPYLHPRNAVLHIFSAMK